MATRRRCEGFRRGMSFTMAPAFFSTDLDRTSKFWGEHGFSERKRYEDNGYPSAKVRQEASYALAGQL